MSWSSTSWKTPVCLLFTQSFLLSPSTVITATSNILRAPQTTDLICPPCWLCEWNPPNSCHPIRISIFALPSIPTERVWRLHHLSLSYSTYLAPELLPPPSPDSGFFPSAFELAHISLILETHTHNDPKHSLEHTHPLLPLALSFSPFTAKLIGKTLNPLLCLSVLMEFDSYVIQWNFSTFTRFSLQASSLCGQSYWRGPRAGQTHGWDSLPPTTLLLLLLVSETLPGSEKPF